MVTSITKLAETGTDTQHYTNSAAIDGPPDLNLSVSSDVISSPVQMNGARRCCFQTRASLTSFPWFLPLASMVVCPSSTLPAPTETWWDFLSFQHFVFLLKVRVEVWPGGLTLLLLLQLYPELQLTEEEQKLLTQEGVSLPNNLPLTKVRLLKHWRPRSFCTS